MTPAASSLYPVGSKVSYSFKGNLPGGGYGICLRGTGTIDRIDIGKADRRRALMTAAVVVRCDDGTEVFVFNQADIKMAR